MRTCEPPQLKVGNALALAPELLAQKSCRQHKLVREIPKVDLGEMVTIQISNVLQEWNLFTSGWMAGKQSQLKKKNLPGQ